MQNSYFGFLALLVVLLSSCNSSKKVTYFQGLSSNRIDSINFNKAYMLQYGDVIEVSVTSLATEDYSHFTKSGFSITDQGMQNAYVVDSSGTIDLPYIGTLNIAGITIQKVRMDIRKAIEPFLQKATINVRLMNLKVSIVGEVAKPGVYQMPDTRLALPEALSLAGDLTILGKRNNVLIIREENGQRTYGRIDLRKTDVLSSPYYYLHPNDIIYVEPSRAKAGQNNPHTWQVITFITTALSLATILVTRL